MHSAISCCLTPAVLQCLALLRDGLWQCAQCFWQLLYAWYHHSCPQKGLRLRLSRGAAGVAVGPHHNQATWNLVPAGKTLHERVVDALDVRLQCSPLQHKTTVVLRSWQWLYALGGVLGDCTCRTWQVVLRQSDQRSAMELTIGKGDPSKAKLSPAALNHCWAAIAEQQMHLCSKHGLLTRCLHCSVMAADMY